MSDIFSICMHAYLLSCVQLFVIPWTVACQAPLTMEYRNGLSFPSPGDLPDPRINPESLALQADSLLSELPGIWQLFALINVLLHNFKSTLYYLLYDYREGLCKQFSFTVGTTLSIFSRHHIKETEEGNISLPYTGMLLLALPSCLTAAHPDHTVPWYICSPPPGYQLTTVFSVGSPCSPALILSTEEAESWGFDACCAHISEVWSRWIS